MKAYRKYLLLGSAGFILLAISVVVVVSHRNTITPSGIIIHHSALPYPQLEPDSYLPLITEIHRERGYGTFYWGRTYYLGYHYLILPDGRIERGRPEHCVGAHARGFNSYIGICLVGDFSTTDNPEGARGLQRPSVAQMQSLVELCRRLISEFNIPQASVVRHSDVNPSTECPGDLFPFQAFLDASAE